MTPKEKKIIIAYLKQRYPIGTVIYDPVRGDHPLKIKKNSTFIVEEWNYSDEFKPTNNGDIAVDCMVKDAGKYSPLYDLCIIYKKWVID